MNRNTENTNGRLLKVDGLKTWFPIRKGLLRRTAGHVKAVDGISFDIAAGKTLGLVGESGCGKTTAARTIIRLIPATEGTVVFEGMDILRAPKSELKNVRRNMSIIFQDPYGSLNPRMTVSNIVGEPLMVHKKLTGTALSDKVAQLLRKVGLSPDYANRYPHEFSGGQRQRIGVARALALDPKLVICDEPVSALDVSIQSQILNLLKDLQDELNLTYLFIAHDLAVVEFFCDTIAVMYMGKIVEKASAQQLYENPLHPYTHLLMSAIPTIEADRKGPAIRSEPPKPTEIGGGCPFHPRCPKATEQCKSSTPALIEDEPGHEVACWQCNPLPAK